MVSGFVCHDPSKFPQNLKSHEPDVAKTFFARPAQERFLKKALDRVGGKMISVPSAAYRITASCHKLKVLGDKPNLTEDISI